MVKKIAAALVVVFFFSCKKDPPVPGIKNLSGNEIKALGHGGSGIGWKFPINTWESVKECLESGADGSEIDIQMTKDSVLVAYHDKTLDDGTNCRGFINEKNWSEIEHCLYKSFLSDHIRLMRVDDLFSGIEYLQEYYFTFDCKLYAKSGSYKGYLNQYADAIIDLIEKYNMTDRVFIESHSTEFLKTLQKKRNDLKLFIYPLNFEKGLKIAEDLNLFGISFDTEYISREQAEIAHSKGFRIALWNIQTQRGNIEAIEKNPDYIQTDKIRHLVKTLRRK